MKLTKDSIGYSNTVYAGKNDQMIQVSQYVAEKGFVPKELVDNEVSWFYG
jgi:glutamate dehydrogenase